MFICNSCETVFEYPKITEQHHPYGMGTAAEEWAVCPHCGDDDIAEAVKCERCGEYFAELHNGLCDICHDDMYGDEYGE